MREYLGWAKNKIYDVYSACTKRLSLTASAIKEKIPAQTRDMLSRPFSEETKDFIRKSPETQRVLIITITGNVLYASISMMKQYNDYLLNEDVPIDEYSIERYARFMAYATNTFLLAFVIRKSIRMVVENALNGACVAKAVVLDHPNDHHQKDCKEKHPELEFVLPKEISWIIPAKFKKQIKEYQELLNEARYKISVISGGLASGVYYFIDMQLVKILCAYLPYSQYAEILLRAIVTGHSLPEYNHGNKCTDHKNEEIRRLNMASFTIGFLHAILVELAYYLTGNSQVKDAVGNVLYQLLIPVIMSKSIKSEQDGADFFYYNRAIACTVMEVAANKTLRVLKGSGYTLKLMYEQPPKKVEENTIYLYLANDEVEPSLWPLRKRKKTVTARKEWLEISVNIEGEEKKIILLPEANLGKHTESIKTVLKSKGKITELADEDKQALYALFAKLGLHKSLGVKLQEAAKSSYVQYAKDALISDDLQSLDLFVRKPDVKRFLDYNGAIFEKVEDVIKIIRESYFARVGNMLPNWWVPENLQNIKKVLEAIFLSKSDVVLVGLHDLLAAHKTHLNEHEESTFFKHVHEPELLVQIQAKSDNELQKYENENKKEEKLQALELIVIAEYEPEASIEIIVEGNIAQTTEQATELNISSQPIQVSSAADSVSVDTQLIENVSSKEKHNPPEKLNLNLTIMDDYKVEKSQALTVPVIMNERKEEEPQSFTVPNKKEEKSRSFILFDENESDQKSTPTKSIPAKPIPIKSTIQQQSFLVGGSIVNLSFFEEYDPSGSINNSAPKLGQKVSQQPVRRFQ